MDKEIIVNRENVEEIDLLDLVSILVKHKMMIFVITSLAMVGVLIYAVISLKLPSEKSYLPNLYKPVSTVRINESSSSGGLSSMMNSSGLGSLAGLMGVGGGGSSDTAFAIKLAKSNTIIDLIADEFDLMIIYDLSESKFPDSKLRQVIRGKLDLQDDESTGTLSISYVDIDRDLATKIVNRVVNILEQRILELDQTSNYSQKILMEKKIADVEMEIAILQQDILNFQNKYDLLDAVTFTEKISEKVVQLRSSLVEKEAAITTYSEKSRIQDPALIKLYEEKTALENTLSALENGDVPGIPSTKELPLILMEYEKLTRNLEVQASIYTTLRGQYELIKLQESGTGPMFQVIEYAEVPEMKSGPSRGKLCIIVAFVAFFSSIFLAFLKEFWDNLKKDPERMAKLKGNV